MFSWKLICGTNSASGWGGSVKQCLEDVLHQLQRMADAEAVPLSLHVMSPSETKIRTEISKAPSKTPIRVTWKHVAGTLFNTLDRPFYRWELKAYLRSKGFDIDDDTLSKFLQERKRLGALHKHGRNMWARHP